MKVKSSEDEPLGIRNGLKNLNVWIKTIFAFISDGLYFMYTPSVAFA